MDSRDKDSRQEASPRDRSKYGEGSNAPGASVSREQMERFDYAAENLLRHRVEAEKEEIHFMPEGEQLFWKPLKYTLGLGVLGLLLLLGAMFMSPLLKVYGNPFHPEGGQDYAGLVRMLMMLTGGMMLIIAWPIRKPRGWSIEEQEQYEDSKQWAANRRMKDDRE